MAVIFSGIDVTRSYALSRARPALLLGFSLLVLILSNIGCHPVKSKKFHNATLNTGQEFLYVTNTAEDTISQYSIDYSGRLIPLLPSKVNSNQRPKILLVSQNHFVYVLNEMGTNLLMYTINYDGSLDSSVDVTPDLPSESQNNNGIAKLEYRKGYICGITISNEGRSLYLALSDGSIAQYSIGPEGFLKLASKVQVSPNDVGWDGAALSVSSNDQYLYFGYNWGLGELILRRNGSLKSTSPIFVQKINVTQIAVCHNAKLVYVQVQNGTGIDKIIWYGVNYDGSLRQHPHNSENFVFASMSSFLAVDPASRNIYSSGIGKVFSYPILSNGNLKKDSVSSFSAGIDNIAMQFTLGGKFAYVLGRGEGMTGSTNDNNLIPRYVNGSESLRRIFLYKTDKSGDLFPLSPSAIIVGKGASSFATARL